MVRSISYYHHSGQKVMIHVPESLSHLDEFPIICAEQKLIDELERTSNPLTDYIIDLEFLVGNSICDSQKTKNG